MLWLKDILSFIVYNACSLKSYCNNWIFWYSYFCYFLLLFYNSILWAMVYGLQTFFFYSLPTTLNLALTIQCLDLQSFYCILFNITFILLLFSFTVFKKNCNYLLPTLDNKYELNGITIYFLFFFFLYLFLTAIFCTDSSMGNKPFILCTKPEN